MILKQQQGKDTWNSIDVSYLTSYSSTFVMWKTNLQPDNAADPEDDDDLMVEDLSQAPSNEDFDETCIDQEGPPIPE